MKEYKIFVGTITHALKGRDILRKNAIKARVERMTSGISKHGCGYVIIAEGNIEKTEEILRMSGIKILEIN